MAYKEVDLPELGAVKIYKRRGTKGLRLTLPPTGGVRVSIPTWLPYRAGVDFARSKKDWINEHRREETVLTDGQFIGKRHKLVLQPAKTSKITTRVGTNFITITHPPSVHSESHPVQEAARKACLRALKSESREQITKRLNQLAAQTGYSYKSVNFKQMKSRWGHCSSNKELTFNIFLIQLPWDLIDYVITHELVHTEVLSHGPEFWGEFSRHIDNPKLERKRLKEYNPAL